MNLPEVRHHYVTENLKLVHKLANRFARSNRDAAIDYSDIFQAGCEGLIHAAAEFDESAGAKFSTYAFRAIYGYMLRQRALVMPIRVPVHITELAHQIIKHQLLEAEPYRIAAHFGCTAEMANKALRSLALTVISSQATDSRSDEAEPYQKHLFTMDDDTAIIVSSFLESLPPKHRVVIRGLLVGRTLADIGEAEGITFQGVGSRINTIRKRWKEYEAMAQ